MNHFKRIFIAVALLGVYFQAGAAKAQQNEQDVNVMVTSDNAYAFAFGDENGIAPGDLEGGVWNSSKSDIQGCWVAGAVGPESYTVTKADEDTYLYIIAWSDNSAMQGTIAQFELMRDGDIISTGDADWELFATGINYSNSTSPSLDVINEQIAVANSASGNATTSSITWVDQDGAPGGRGVLDVGVHPVISKTCPAMPDEAQWMAYNPTPNDTLNPFKFQSISYHAEFWIFRIPLRFQPLDVDIEQTCEPNGSRFDVDVISDGQPISHVWYEVNNTSVDLCNGNCPADYSGSFTLPQTEGTIQVFATSDAPNVHDDSDTLSWVCEIEDPAWACVHGATLVDVRNKSAVYTDITAGEFREQSDMYPTLVDGNVSVEGYAFLGNMASITGTLTVPTEDHIDAQLGAYIHELAYETLSFPLIPEKLFSYSTIDFNVPVDSYDTLDPGDWGAVDVESRSTLVLTSGKYGMASLHVNTDSEIILDVSNGPIEINVEGNVEFKSYVSIQGTAGMQPEDVAPLVSWYTNGDFIVHNDVQLLGPVVAPYGEIAVSDRNDIYGCLAGDVVTIDNVNKVWAYTFVEWPEGSCGDGTVDAEEACDDGNSVNDDDCTNNCENNVNTCNDGVISGDETDVDCGGSCGGCELQEQCLVNDDCLSAFCNAGVCQEPTSTCNAQTAIELNSGSTVATNACLKLTLPAWANTAVLQPSGANSYPVPLSWDGCATGGSSQLAGDWQSTPLSATGSCTVVIDLQGSASDSVILSWWSN